MRVSTAWVVLGIVNHGCVCRANCSQSSATCFDGSHPADIMFSGGVDVALAIAASQTFQVEEERPSVKHFAM
jgi:hypothetical protein